MTEKLITESNAVKFKRLTFKTETCLMIYYRCLSWLIFTKQNPNIYPIIDFLSFI